MKNFYPYCIVFFSGAIIIALELLGIRILGPFYGVDLYLWTMIISITLISLSLGYSVGGRWADRYPFKNNLSSIVGIAGIWIIMIPWIKHSLLIALENIDLRISLFIVSTIFFFLPFFLLGMIIPFAIKLKVSNLANLGTITGDLYATSTFGGVVSAIAARSFLIPLVGIDKLTFIIGGFLIISSSIGYFIKNKPMIMTVLMLPLIFAIWGFAKPPNESLFPEQGLLAIAQSPYGEYRIVDTKNARHLLLDGCPQALVDLQTSESHYPYVSLMDMPMYIHKQLGKMLLVGLGAGSIVKNYTSAGWKVDAVEIDPAIVNLARKYFSFQMPENNIFIMDGRQFLKGSKENYDVILLDAIVSGGMPFQLVTAEYVKKVKSHLAKHGILSMNVEASGWHDIIVRSVAATLHTSFNNVIALPIAEPPSEVGNIVVIASDDPPTLEREIVRDYANPDFRFSNNYWKVHGWDNLFEPDISGAPILTDDLNPIDVWSEKTNYMARKDWHGYFSENKLSW